MNEKTKQEQQHGKEYFFRFRFFSSVLCWSFSASIRRQPDKQTGNIIHCIETITTQLYIYYYTHIYICDTFNIYRIATRIIIFIL